MAGWDVDRAATELLAREDERRDGPPLTDSWPELDLETAYAVQDETLRRRLDRGRRWSASSSGSPHGPSSSGWGSTSPWSPG